MSRAPGDAAAAGGSPEICAVTGLPIRRREVWKDPSAESDYAVSIRVVGERILECRPAGFAGLTQTIEAYACIWKIVEEAFGGSPYVWVHDYSALRGASVEARQHFIELMRTPGAPETLIFCHTSPMQRIGIELARGMYQMPVKVRVVGTREQALLRALTLTPGATAPARGGAAWRSGDALALPSLDLEGFTVHYRDLGLGRLEIESHGELREPLVSQVIAGNSRSTRLVAPEGGAVVLLDVRGVAGADLAARRAYAAGVRGWHAETRFAAAIFYGADRSLQAAINLGRFLQPFPVYAVATREKALAIARERPWRSRRRGLLRRGQRGVATREEVAEEVLRRIGRINWSGDADSPPEDSGAEGDPLAQVDEALRLIKSDVEELHAELRRSIDALTATEARYRTLLESMVDGYYEIDIDGRFTFCNESLLSMLNRSGDSILGKSYTEVLEAGIPLSGLRAFRRVRDGGAAARAVPLRLVAAGGRIVEAEISIALAAGAGGEPTGFRGTVRDVTERAREREQRERIERRLAQVQKLEAIGTLAAGIAHNFNNLLMGIQGHASLGALEAEGNAALRERMTAVEQLVDVGKGLTRELLGFARVQPPELRSLDLNDLTRRTVEAFAATRRDLRVRLDLAGDLDRVRGDAGQIQQALMNLLVNAAAAMPGGGDLDVQTRNTVGSGREVGSPEEARRRFVALAVRDRGVGMDDAIKGRIFEPFFTTKPAGEGSGLGLASVYGTVRAHGGRVEVESRVGEGSTFTLRLPSVHGAEEAAVRPEPGRSAVGSGTILVIDDEPSVRSVTAGLLRSLGYVVLDVGSGAEGVAAVAERAGQLDLVMLDMILPDMPGRDVHARLRASAPALPILLASGYSREGEAESLLAQDRMGFIQKPFSRAQLAAAVEALLDARRDGPGGPGASPAERAS